MDNRVFQNWRLPESPQNALLRGLQMQRAQQGNALQAMQLQQAEQQMAEQAQQRNALEAFKGSIVSPQMQASQQALQGGGGPTLANAARMPAVDPRTQMLYGAMQAGQIAPMDYLNAAMPAPMKPERKVVGDAYIESGPNGVRELYRAPKATALPSGMQMGANGPEWIPGYLEGRGQVARAGASSISYGAPMSAINPATGKPELVRPDSKGGMQFTGVAPAGEADKPLTEAQAKATTFLGQMRSASQTLRNIKADQTILSNQAESALAGGPANVVVRERAQQVRQAQDQWAEAYLRFKTGAAATEGEVAQNRRTFFPVIGDKPAQVEQKRQAREQAERDMEISAGRGAGQLTTPRGGTPTNDADPLGLRGK